MQKIISIRTVALLALVLLTTQAQAQQLPAIGLKGGPDLATFTGGALGQQVTWKPGYTAGLLMTYPLSARSGLQVEALYTQKGVQQEGYQHVYRDPAFFSISNTYFATLSYFDLPVLYTLGPGSTGQGVFVEAGPQLSISVSRREFVRPTGKAVGGEHEETLATDLGSLAPVSAGYVAGLGYQWANGLGAELRYSGDFTQVYRTGCGAGYLATSSNSQPHNGVLHLQVRYLFGKKQRPAPEYEVSQPTRYERPLPPPLPPHLDSLARTPQVRRLVQLFSLLVWLNGQVRINSGPVCRPAPGLPPSRPLPGPRPQMRRLPNSGPVLK